MTDYAQVLSRKFPDATWTLNGDGYEGLTWKSDSPKPAQAHLDDLWPTVQAEMEAERTAAEATRDAAIAHAKSLGFTDEMIAVMYPGLTV